MSKEIPGISEIAKTLVVITCALPVSPLTSAELNVTNPFKETRIGDANGTFLVGQGSVRPETANQITQVARVRQGRLAYPAGK